MKRQLDDYYSKFYCKEAKRFKELSANDNAKAKEIAAWKEEVVAKWDSIEIVSKRGKQTLHKAISKAAKSIPLQLSLTRKD